MNDFNEWPAHASQRQPWVTYTLAATCAGIFLLQIMAGGGDLNHLAYPGFVDSYYFYEGAYWGLLTSFFLHIGLMHVAFNVYWLLHFGRGLEPYIGHVRFFLFWLVATLVSNAVQIGFCGETGVGASGFGYALFGFAWVAGRAEPELRPLLDSRTVLLFVIWLFLCIFSDWSGLMAVANGAHVGGVLFGCLCAYAFIQRHEAIWKWSVPAFAVLSFVPIFYAPWLSVWNLVQGDSAFRRENYRAAITYLERVRLPEYEVYVSEMLAESMTYLGQEKDAATVYDRLFSSHSGKELTIASHDYNEYAWMLATSTGDKLRDPQKAIHFATLACDEDDYKQSDSLDTLATAYAAAGQFDDAVKTEQKAIDANTDPDALAELKARLKLFEDKTSYREKPRKAGTANP
jgi:membrane associated rhomboid family serine protease